MLFADRVRNDAGIPTIASGHLRTSDEINTVLAAGRADLCVMAPPLEPPEFAEEGAVV
jgi:anthraniloyl-CoA monooxygenase